LREFEILTWLWRALHDSRQLLEHSHGRIDAHIDIAHPLEFVAGSDLSFQLTERSLDSV
jgi:hypothetical protein